MPHVNRNVGRASGACSRPTYKYKRYFIPPIDNSGEIVYNTHNFIRQFVTILSLNKTRESDGQFLPILFCMGADCTHFYI